MATVTLTPLHYYQLDGNQVVTAIDPTSKAVKADNKIMLIEFAYANTFRHKYITNMSFSFSGGSGNRDYTVWGTSVKEAPSIGDMARYYAGDIIYEHMGGSSNFYFLSNFAPGYPSFFLAMDSAYTNTNFTFSSLTLTLTYTTADILGVSMSPTTGFIDPAQSKTFTATAKKRSGASDPMQWFSLASGVLHYKKTDDESYTDISQIFTGTPNTIELPANSLVPGSTYDIYLSVTGDDGATADSAVGSFTTVDGTAVATPVSPKNTLEQGTVRLIWNYYNERGTRQYAYEIKYTVNGGSEVFPTGKVVSQDTETTITIPTAGTVAWSVRAYNQDDVAGNWSEAITFVNAVPPSPPVISDVSHQGRPVVSWICADQVAFQAQALSNDEVVYDSGTIYSGAQQYQLEKFLPDGSYVFRVRIFNSLGYSSDWAEVNYDQAFPGLPDITLTAEGQADGIAVSFTPDVAYAAYYLERNGKVIAEVPGGSYIDLFPGASNIYTLIAVTSEGYTKFSEKEISYIPETTTIKTADGRQIDASKRWTQRIAASKAVSPEVGVFSFIGASRPEVIASKMRTIRYTFGFYDQDRIAEDLIGQDIFYSDIYGNADWCQITAITRTDGWYGNETALELTAVLHDEEITIT